MGHLGMDFVEYALFSDW